MSGGAGIGGNAPSLGLDEIGEQWPLIRVLLDDDVYRETYGKYVGQTVEDAFEPAAMIERIRQARALIEPYVIGPEGEQPGSTFVTSAEAFETSFEQLLAQVSSRAQAVEAFLSTGP